MLGHSVYRATYVTSDGSEWSLGFVDFWETIEICWCGIVAMKLFV